MIEEIRACEHMSKAREIINNNFLSLEHRLSLLENAFVSKNGLTIQINKKEAGELVYYSRKLNEHEGYLIPDGSEVSREKYPELYKAIGDTYGSGDGSTTFNLPKITTSSNDIHLYIKY